MHDTLCHHCLTHTSLQRAGKDGHLCLSPWYILWLSLHTGRYNLCFSGTAQAFEEGLVGHCLNLILHGVSSAFGTHRGDNDSAMGSPIVGPQQHLLYQKCDLWFWLVWWKATLLEFVIKQVNLAWIVVCPSIHTCTYALFIIPPGKRQKIVLLFLFPFTEDIIASKTGNKINFIYGISLHYCWLFS